MRARAASAWAIALVAILAGGRSAAVECTDFPVGTRVNAWSGDIQHAIGLAYSQADPVLYTVWADHRAPLTPEVYCARSLDHGVTFTAGIEVCPSQTLRVSGNPVLDVGPGKALTVVWAGEEVNGLDVYLVRSLDGGQSFSPPIRVNDRDLGDESLPAVRVTPAGTTFVAWVEHPIGDSPGVRIASALAGEPFGPSVEVNGDAVPSSCECCIVDVAIINEKEVYVAFMANQNYVRDLYLARSADGGATFADPVQLSEGHWYEPACPTSGPRLQVGPDGVLNLVWVDAHDFAPQASVYYARTTNGGASFENRTRLNVENDFVTGHPHFVVTDQNAVHVAWERFNPETSAFNLDYTSSTDGGATFTERCPVSGGSAISQWQPALAAAPGGQALTLGWHEAREETFDLYAASVLAQVGVGEAGAPGAASVRLVARPNPFVHSVELDFRPGMGRGSGSGIGSVLSAQYGPLRIYDAQGREVCALRVAGSGVRWDGRDASGRSVPAGTYFLKPSGGAEPLKVIRVR
jgi:hypothetical protein